MNVVKELSTNQIYLATSIIPEIKRKSLFGDGHDSPLIQIEHHMVSLLICMSKLKHYLQISEYIMLINSVIKATDYQTQLIELNKNME